MSGGDGRTIAQVLVVAARAFDTASRGQQPVAAVLAEVVLVHAVLRAASHDGGVGSAAHIAMHLERHLLQHE